MISRQPFASNSSVKFTYRITEVIECCVFIKAIECEEERSTEDAEESRLTGAFGSLSDDEATNSSITTSTTGANTNSRSTNTSSRYEAN